MQSAARSGGDAVLCAVLDLNRLCQAVQPMDGKQKETLAAAVLMAKPECAAEIRELAINLEQFELVTDIGSAVEYGEYLIKESFRASTVHAKTV